MHIEISASFGVEFLLEFFVLWVIGRPIGYDENRLDLEGGQKRKTEVSDAKSDPPKFVVWLNRTLVWDFCSLLRQ